ncbi:MAG: hypothetical protein WCS93_06675 [Candidatus Delongbacteria bacterium]
MDNTVIITLLTITLPLFGAGVGFLIKHNIEKKKDLMSEVTKTRRDLYQQFVDLIIDIFENSKTGKQQPEKQLMTKLYTFYKKYVLYASPDVINTYADYFQYLYNHETSNGTEYKVHFKKLTRILAAMRKDLGLKNKDLGKDGERLFRALITDFDTIIKNE